MALRYEEEFMSCPAFWFGTYHVRVTDTELNFGFTLGCAQKNVLIEDIRKVTLLEWQDPLCNWGGWGIRWMIYPHKETGYVPRAGPAIRLELPPTKEGDGNQIYVFVCSDANRVKELLMEPVVTKEGSYHKDPSYSHKEDPSSHSHSNKQDVYDATNDYDNDNQNNQFESA